MQEKTSEPIYRLMNELDLPEIYTIMTAMRGCDFSLPIHKDIFTARIRYLIFGRKAWGVVRDEPKLTINEIIGLILEAFLMGLMNREDEYLHYINHICDAFSILSDSVVLEEEESEIQWLLRLCTNLKNVGESYYYGAIENIQELVAEYVDLDKEVYVEISLRRDYDQKEEKILSEGTALRNIFSAEFLESIKEGFKEFEKALKTKGVYPPIIQLSIELYPGNAFIEVSERIYDFPEFSVHIGTDEEGKKKWRPSI